jgi:hypothetical protein
METLLLPIALDLCGCACEAGKGWEACKACCTPGATFAAQAEPLADFGDTH